jgi:hypothetical protein
MKSNRKAIIGSAVLLTLAGGAAGLATTTSASAATDTTDTTVAAATDSGATLTPPADTDTDAGTGHGAPGGPHSANGITEEVLTGDTAASVEAAVKAALPDATIERMETDAEGAVYEAHVTVADGSDATVKLDANFAITETVQGHG